MGFPVTSYLLGKFQFLTYTSSEVKYVDNNSTSVISIYNKSLDQTSAELNMITQKTAKNSSFLFSANF